MSIIEKIELPKDANERLKLILFSTYVNKDSLSRQLSQQEMILIDSYANNILSSIYGLVDRALNDDKKMVEESMERIKVYINIFFYLSKEILEKKEKDK